MVNIVVIVRAAIFIQGQIPEDDALAPVASNVNDATALVKKRCFPLWKSPFSTRSFSEPDILARIFFMDDRHHLFVPFVPVPRRSVYRIPSICVFVKFQRIRTLSVIGGGIAVIPAKDLGINPVLGERGTKIICYQRLGLCMGHG